MLADLAALRRRLLTDDTSHLGQRLEDVVEPVKRRISEQSVTATIAGLVAAGSSCAHCRIPYVSLTDYFAREAKPLAASTTRCTCGCGTTFVRYGESIDGRCFADWLISRAVA